MVDLVLAEVVMTAHFAFLAYLVVGGFLAWRWPRTVVAHGLVAAWGLSSVVFEIECPLTDLEDRFRSAAGQQGLDRGFIDTYLTGVLYPPEYLRLIQLLVAVVVLFSWVGLYLRHRRRTPQRTVAR